MLKKEVKIQVGTKMSELEQINLQNPALYHEFKFLSEKTTKKSLVLFFGRSTFCDNSKYLFLACQRQNPKFNVVWCTAEKELHARLIKHGLASFYVAEDWRNTVNLFLEAACVVYCENPYSALWGLPILRGCLSGATQIQLWHGVSVKHLDLMLIQHQYFNILSSKFRDNLIAATQIDYLASSSAYFDPFWIKAFGAAKLLRVGQARNEVLFRDAYDLELIDSIFNEEIESVFSSDSMKILIAPTWQRNKNTWLNSELFFKKIDEIGKRKNIDFYLKLHPFSLRDDHLQSNYRKKYKRVHQLDAGFDVYPWMKFFHAIISDYSSIMFDFLTTGKPTFSLVINDGRHSFEPDFSLLPSIDGLYQFTPENFDEIFFATLKNHEKRAEQQEMICKIFETDPRSTNQILINFLENEVSYKVNKKFEVYNF
jgi:CDP-glycerol glycerophosphotransferase